VVETDPGTKQNQLHLLFIYKAKIRQCLPTAHHLLFMSFEVMKFPLQNGEDFISGIGLPICLSITIVFLDISSTWVDSFANESNIHVLPFQTTLYNISDSHYFLPNGFLSNTM